MDQTIQLAHWQFWLQIGAFIFGAGGLWMQLRGLRKDVDDLISTVRTDHDNLVSLKGHMEGISSVKEIAHKELERRIGLVETRVFGNGE